MARQPNQGRADLKLGREELEPWSTGATFLASRQARRLGGEGGLKSRRVSMAFPEFFPSQPRDIQGPTRRDPPFPWEAVGNLWEISMVNMAF